MRTTLAHLATRLATGALAGLALAACNHVSADTESRALRDPACPLAINEVAAAGEPTDWFELVNVSRAPLDLSAFVFTDAETSLAHAAHLPPTVLAPGARHVQEVTAADAGFRLGGEDALYLYRADDGHRCDGVRWHDDDAPRGGSLARLPDGTGGFETAMPDTRGVRNR